MKHMLVGEADSFFKARKKATPIVRKKASYSAVMRIELYHVP
jgi:hypothetical protein